MDEAAAYASEVLGQHLDVLGEFGEDIPAPSSIATIIAPAGGQVVPVTAAPVPPRASGVAL